MAETVNCHIGRPKRSVKSRPTASASSVGNIAVKPEFSCFLIAATVAAGECPVIEPVSPKQKSIYVLPSTSLKCAPLALFTKSGYAPGHLVIHDIGTPPGIVFFACLKSAPLFLVRARKRFSSIFISFARWSRLIICKSYLFFFKDK